MLQMTASANLLGSNAEFCKRLLGKNFSTIQSIAESPAHSPSQDSSSRAFLLIVYSMSGETPRTCYGATLFGRFAAEAA